MAEATIQKPAAQNQSLAEWRTAMGYSQRDAADALGCSRTALGGWELNNDTPKYIRLAMAALALGIKVDGDEAAPPRDPYAFD